MKLSKLNAHGVAHHLVLAVIVVGVAIGGTYMAVRSFADTKSPAAICGSGYVRVATKDTQNKTAETELFVNKSAQKYCALFYATGAYGTAHNMGLFVSLTKKTGPNACNEIITPTSGKPYSDSGKYKYYAGPVYVSYAGKQYCSVYVPGEFGDKVGGIYPSAFIRYKP